MHTTPLSWIDLLIATLRLMIRLDMESIVASYKVYITDIKLKDMNCSKDVKAYKQYPLPPDVRMVVDCQEINDRKWCLILNYHFFHGLLGRELNLTPSFCVTYKVRVEDDNGSMLVVSSVDKLSTNAIMGSLIYHPSFFANLGLYLSFLDRREHGCYVNVMKEILKTFNIVDYTVTRF